jgi:hypothetical protein
MEGTSGQSSTANNLESSWSNAAQQEDEFNVFRAGRRQYDEDNDDVEDDDAPDNEDNDDYDDDE